MKAAEIKRHIQILIKCLPYTTIDIKEALFTAIGCMTVTYKEFLRAEKLKRKAKNEKSGRQTRKSSVRVSKKHEK